MIRIIAFTGKRGNGKTTASNKVKEVLEGQGLTVVRLNFKDGLISTINEKMPLILEDLSKHYKLSIEDLFNIKPPIMRNLMQQVGTEIYRAIDDEYWTKQYKIMIEGMKKDIVIITDDVRFQNEFDVVKELGGNIYRIIANNKPEVKDSHQSEVEQESFNCAGIISASSKEDLERQIVELLPTL